MNASKAMISKSTTGHSSLQRPRYSAGLLLRDDDLGLAVDYTRELSRLLFRSLVGCGVVCGLKVEAGDKCGQLHVKVHKGVALDCRGNPIHLCEDVEITQPVDCGEKRPRCVWVLLRYAEKCCAPRTALCAGEEDEAASASVCTRERDGYEIRITDQEPNCACGCLKASETPAAAFGDPCECADPNSDCYRAHYDGECGCQCGDCTDCDCDWVVLAKTCYGKSQKEGELAWYVHHQFRRYVRPVLAEDPLARAPQPAAAMAPEGGDPLGAALVDAKRQVLEGMLAREAERGPQAKKAAPVKKGR